MKICSRCGHQNEEENIFCENCGNRLDENNQIQQSEATTKVQKEKNKGILLGGALVVVIIVAAVVYFGKIKQENNPILEETNKKIEQQENITSEEDKSEDSPKENNEITDGETKENDGAEQDNKNASVEVDIDAIENAYINVQGVVLSDGDEYKIVLDQEVTVRVCNSNNEEQILQKVKEIKAKSTYDLYEYVGANILANGKMQMDDGTLNVKITQIDVLSMPEKESEIDFSNSSYELVVADVDWNTANELCLEKGGHLVRINSKEEFDYIISLIEQEEKEEVHFYLGGRREMDEKRYYWVDDSGQLIKDGDLNPEGNQWSASYWMENEPSFSSDTDLEMYMNLLKYKDEWVLNDIPVDITKYYSGKTGYICEY